MGTKLKIKRDINVTDAATTLDIHPQTLRGYIQKGAPCERRGGQIFVSLSELAAWMQVNRLTGEAGRPPQPGTAELVAAKVRTQLWLARRYELEVKRLERENREHTTRQQFRAEAVQHCYAVALALEIVESTPPAVRESLQAAHGLAQDYIHHVWYAAPTATDETISARLAHTRIMALKTFFTNLLFRTARRARELENRPADEITRLLDGWFVAAINAWDSTHKIEGAEAGNGESNSANAKPKN